MGMSDKERILKGLEQCERRWVGACRIDEDWPCRTCPYYEKGYACIAHLVTDTLELLRLPEHQVCANCHYRAVQVTWQCGKAYCGACGKRIPGKIKANYCHKCGREILWIDTVRLREKAQGGVPGGV